jgi:hypothetical protein
MEPEGFSTVDPDVGFLTEWSTRQAAVTALVWSSATLPWLLACAATWRGALRPWVVRTAALCSVAAVLGFELWFTYGLLDGQPVNERRPEPLNRSMPLHINWLLNSLSDGSICMVGMLIIHVVDGEPGLRGPKWRSGLLCVIWFLAQNVLVEMVIYSGQLAEGTTLSWAPLAPTGPYWNPTLFR